MNMNEYSLYILACPIENIVRYVGISKNPLNRFKDHLKNNEENLYKQRWIKKVLDKKLKPILIIVSSELDENKAKLMEVDLIKLYRYLLGSKLTNIHEGGGIPPRKFGDDHHKFWKNKFGCKNPNAKSIDKYDLNGNFIQTYDSIVDAELELNRKQNRSNIGMVCKGKRQTSLGFIWRWHNDDLNKYYFNQKYKRKKIF